MASGPWAQTAPDTRHPPRTRFKTAEGQYHLLAERATGLVPFNYQRSEHTGRWLWLHGRGDPRARAGCDAVHLGASALACPPVRLGTSGDEAAVLRTWPLQALGLRWRRCKGARRRVRT